MNKPIPTDQVQNQKTSQKRANTYLPLIQSNQIVDNVNLLPHTVQSGETLSSIAQKYGVSLDVLENANPQLEDPSLIYPGFIINIPIVVEPEIEDKSASVVDGSSPNKNTALNFLNELDINGEPINQIIVLTAPTIDHIREIYARGQELGNDPHAFSKIGDSTIESPFFMDRFDEGTYKLGPYEFLQPAIDAYRGSYSHQGQAVKRGMHAWSIFDPLWADKTYCQPNESPVDCEFRTHNPSIVFIRLGSNDVGRMDLFEKNIRKLIETSIDNGVIPIVGTKADRNEGSNANNEKLRALAEDYDVPLWDFDIAAQTLPNSGLDVDGVHLTTFYAHDYNQPLGLQRGYGIHTLTALMMLYAIWQLLP